MKYDMKEEEKSLFVRGKENSFVRLLGITEAWGQSEER